jgi:hypothetical protein
MLILYPSAHRPPSPGTERAAARLRLRYKLALRASGVPVPQSLIYDTHALARLAGAVRGTRDA